MKNVFLILTIALASVFSGNLLAQAPEKMSYQAVIRDASNNLLNNASVSMRVSILQGSASGSSVYVETHTTTSNANGLVTIEIGAGTIVSGFFSNIDWTNGPYYIQIETDPSGGTNYSLVSTSQLMSVPYALHAKNTDSWTTNLDTVFTNNRVGVGTSSPSGVLEVVTNSTISNLVLTGNGTNSGKISLGNNSSTGEYYYIASRNNGNLAIGNTVTAAAFTDCITIKPNSNVGIGTSSPMSKLHIYQDAVDTNLVMIGAAGNYSSGIHLGELATQSSNGRGTLLINEGGALSSGFNGFKIVSGVDGAFGYDAIVIPNFPASKNGFVGIGINPQQKFHVNDVMRLEPRNTAPTTPAKGDIYFDGVLNKLRVYDGTTWQNCW
jgi:hypothetical protein